MKYARWIVTAVGAAALVVLAAPAHAENDPDAVFLAAVDQAGIEYTDPQEAVAVGRQVCDYLQSGHGPDAAARALKISNRSLSVKNAARFVAFSKTAFCPN
ncbi:hypothetical protein MTER_37510 [Mycolicibacter terrae]|uniref:DUF732 domain-containing protein n=1 Tax=Mycolicibacter terrae TaxID=1788 RepID=A0AAD1MJM0_9MYCO|nr:DUF732 domain-containing protein [Mycolicibacter terrae]ORW93554.1 hypothetical protein AWC28_15825 [Mycolicibacter terrae]BBX24340.1 hypothetical protein MTER_37510 [Mycolicibacter terrae]